MNTVIITGAASGVGRHLVGAFLARGYGVVATDVNADGLRDAALQWPADRVATLLLDVRDPAAWQGAVDLVVQRWGRVDVLMNVAGYLKPGYLIDTDATEVDRHFDINVKGLVHGCRVVGRYMASQGRGHIVNISSMAGLAAIPGIGLYSASKFAVRAISLALADELKSAGVAVTVLCPDAIETPMLTLQEHYDEAALTFSGRKPLVVDDIERVLFARVLPDRPLEVFIPFDRGVLAKVANVSPSIASWTATHLRRFGQHAQKKRLEHSA